MSFANLLNTTCKIQTVTEARDASYGVTRTTAVRYNGVPCRLDGASGDEFRGDNRIIDKATHKLFMPLGYGVKVTDQVVCNGSTYNVLSVTDAGGHGHHTELILELVQ